MSRHMTNFILVIGFIYAVFLLCNESFKLGEKASRDCDYYYNLGKEECKEQCKQDMMNAYNQGWQDGYGFKKNKFKKGKSEESFFKG